jgi:hypothetical protein
MKLKQKLDDKGRKKKKLKDKNKEKIVRTTIHNQHSLSSPQVESKVNF